MEYKKGRADSPENQSRIAQTASRLILPPYPLREKAEIFFDEIINDRVKADWTPHMISMAAIAAQLMESVCLNPLDREVTKKVSSVLQIRKSLGLESKASNNRDARSAEITRRIAKRIEDKITSVTEMEDGDLLARPEWQ